MEPSAISLLLLEVKFMMVKYFSTKAAETRFEFSDLTVEGTVKKAEALIISRSACCRIYTVSRCSQSGEEWYYLVSNGSVQGSK